MLTAQSHPRLDTSVRSHRSSIQSHSGNLTVRPLNPCDVYFVRSLAAELPGFTIPSEYELWMLRRFDSKTCRIAEADGRGPIGYLLARAIPESHELFIWQLACTTLKGGNIRAAKLLGEFVKAYCLETDIQRIRFTMIPGSPRERAIFSLSIEILGHRPSVMPADISAQFGLCDDREYVISITS
ncbi:MAG TPA: hypothetical protein VNW97_14865 [Candidatus Saccharimonadales bacterium]|jgi:hypothetical protein|nr:hypothetical protein [Candidatus Saccharimonadales bacterium]